MISFGRSLRWLAGWLLVVGPGGCSLDDHPTLREPDGGAGNPANGGDGGGSSNGGASSGGTVASNGGRNTGAAGPLTGGSNPGGAAGTGANAGSGAGNGARGTRVDSGVDSGTGGADASTADGGMSGANGGTAGAGGTGTGGSNGGATGSGGTGGSGGGTAVGSVGATCSPNGASACAGHGQANKLLCTSGKWAANGACATGNCDTRPGSGAGTCAPIVAACKGKNGGDAVCNAQVAEKCGDDLISVTSTSDCSTQSKTCVNGACQGQCTFGTKHCLGATSSYETCSTAGAWENTTPCPVSAPTCSGAGNCVCATGTVCTGVCVDEQTSKSNCGGCGLGCSTTCEAGRCVEPLATDDQGMQLAVDDTYVFWVGLSDASIYRVGLQGTLPRKLASASPRVLTGFFYDGEIYYSTATSNTLPATDTSGTVQAVQYDGVNPSTLASMRAFPGNITGDALYLYWSELNSVVRYDRGSGDITPVPNLGGAAYLALDGSTIYASSSNGATGAGSIVSTPKSGGAVKTLATGFKSPLAIALDAQNVYVTDYDFQISGNGNHQLAKVPIGGGKATTLATNTGVYVTSDLAVDDTYVYWADFVNGAIRKVAKTGGAVTTVVAGLKTPTHVVVSGNSVYFTHAQGVSKVTPK
jgi:hypothetical protein